MCTKRQFVLTCNEKTRSAGMGMIAAAKNANTLPSEVIRMLSPVLLSTTPVCSCVDQGMQIQFVLFQIWTYILLLCCSRAVSNLRQVGNDCEILPGHALVLRRCVSVRTCHQRQGLRPKMAQSVTWEKGVLIFYYCQFSFSTENLKLHLHFVLPAIAVVCHFHDTCTSVGTVTSHEPLPST